MDTSPVPQQLPRICSSPAALAAAVAFGSGIRPCDAARRRSGGLALGDFAPTPAPAVLDEHELLCSQVHAQLRPRIMLEWRAASGKRSGPLRTRDKPVCCTLHACQMHESPWALTRCGHAQESNGALAPLKLLNAAAAPAVPDAHGCQLTTFNDRLHEACTLFCKACRCSITAFCP